MRDARREAYRGPNNPPVVQSRKTETAYGKQFGVLIAPSEPQPTCAPKPECRTGWLASSAKSLRRDATKDPHWRGKPSAIVRGESTEPWTTKLYREVIERQERLSAADFHASANRAAILQRKSPPAPKPSDPVGYVPKCLQFNQRPWRGSRRFSRLHEIMSMETREWDDFINDLRGESRETLACRTPDHLDTDGNDSPSGKRLPKTLEERQALMKHKDLFAIAELMGECTMRQIADTTGLSLKQVRLRMETINELLKEASKSTR